MMPRIEIILYLSTTFSGAGISIIATYLIYIAGSSVFRGFMSIFLINTFQDPLPWTTCNNPWNTLTCKINPFIDTGNATRQNGRFAIESLVSTTPSNISGTTNATTETNVNRTSAGMTAAEEFWQYDVNTFFCHRSASLTHHQTTNFRLFQTERVCRRQFQI